MLRSLSLLQGCPGVLFGCSTRVALLLAATKAPAVVRLTSIWCGQRRSHALLQCCQFTPVLLHLSLLNWMSQAPLDALVRDFANPRSTDRYFPFARNKDWFDGHSWASGYAVFGAGKNQARLLHQQATRFSTRVLLAGSDDLSSAGSVMGKRTRSGPGRSGAHG